MHIYIEEDNMLHIISKDWNYIDIVNSSSFFL